MSIARDLIQYPNRTFHFEGIQNNYIEGDEYPVVGNVGASTTATRYKISETQTIAGALSSKTRVVL